MSTKIEWAEHVWNPVSGCTRVSAGCDNCYAVTMTRRLASMRTTAAKYGGLVHKGHFNGVVRCHEDLLDIPLKRKKPTTYFVNSMGDLFHVGVPFEFIDRVFAVMALCPQHTFIVLTKRPERMAEYLSRAMWSFDVALAVQHYDSSILPDGPHVSVTLDDLNIAEPLPNVILGTSIEDQATADERIPRLLKCPAAVRLLSIEPLLAGVRLGFCDPRSAREPDEDSGPGVIECFSGRHWRAFGDYGVNACGAGWVITGGESGPGARPMELDWARRIRDDCKAAGVPFFMKQICDAKGRKIPFDDWPEDLKVREMPEMAKAGA